MGLRVGSGDGGAVLAAVGFGVDGTGRGVGDDNGAGKSNICSAAPIPECNAE